MISGEITVVIVSDTHGVLDDRIAEIIEDADIAVHAGDIGDSSVLELMRPRSGKIFAVRGNNDHPVLWPSEQSSVLSEIPSVAQVDLPGGHLVVEHGDRFGYFPDHENFRRIYADARLIVYGHTHKLVIDDDRNPWVANPGAAGQTRTNGGPSCIRLTASQQDWQIESIRFSS